MNTDNMNLYCIVYEAGGISQASEILFLSHQAVSRRIASIEKEVGATLFERTTRGLAPTKAGQDAYQTFKQLLDAYRKLQSRLGDQSINRPVIRLAVEFYDIDVINHEAILAFEKEHPAHPCITTKYLSNMECYRSLLGGRIDLALTNRPFINIDKFDFISLRTDRACIAVAENSPLATKARLEPLDFEGQTFLAIIDADGTNQAFIERFKEYGVNVLTEAVTFDMNSLASLIQSNRGLHVTPEAYTKPLKNRPGITTRLLPGFNSIFDIGLVAAKNRPLQRLLDEFAAYLVDHADDIMCLE